MEILKLNEIKCKRFRILEMWHLFNRELKTIKDFQFARFLNKNKILLKDEIEFLQEMQKYLEKYEEFNKKRIKICEKYSEKNEDGTSKIENNEYVLKNKNRLKCESELALLQEGYSDAIKEQEERTKEFEKMLNEEIEIKLMTINTDYIAEKESIGNEISAEYYEILESLFFE
jgi:flagellar biosynthesis GTPase FlhF